MNDEVPILNPVVQLTCAECRLLGTKMGGDWHLCNRKSLAKENLTTADSASCTFFQSKDAAPRPSGSFRCEVFRRT